MWYSGYNKSYNDSIYLGYATSTDGFQWERYSDRPIFDKGWTEDVFVVKQDSLYYMYAEGGKDDIAHYLTSPDGLNWQAGGDLIILKQNGDTISGPYGTPAVWIENGKWYLFYERDDRAIWLATSIDKKSWKNIQDEPVIQPGPEKYDAGAVAANQIVKYKGRYYLYYHASTNPNWADPNEKTWWTSNVAMSKDLIHWKKYPANPIVDGDHSSPILVPDGNKYRLYTMHNKVFVYLPG